MRKKIGKRIGPVPITLAVFALAAFLSVGLLLTLNGNVTQAQGLPGEANDGDATTAPCVVASADADSVTAVTIDGPGCTTSGDTIDVTFQNTSTDDDLILFVYATGGGEFASMQAAKSAIGDADNDLGAVGIDEHMLEIGTQTSIAGVNSPGAESITVDRSMAKGGEVYLFAYRANADGNFSRGVPVSFLTASAANKAPFQRTALLGSAEDAIGAVTTTLSSGDSLTPPADSGVTDSPSDLRALLTPSSSGVNYTVTILGPDDTITTDDTVVTAADITAANAKVIIQRIEGAVAQLEAVIGVEEAVNVTDDIKNSVTAAKVAIANAQAVVDAVDGNPQRFPNFDANIVVLVKFQNAAVEKIDDRTISKVDTTTVSSKGESRVTITVKDGNEVGLNGFRRPRH